MPIHSQTFLNALPPEWHVPLLPLIQAHVADAAKVVVLDDDPTGTQTVHGVPVLTGWSTQALAGELRDPSSLFYILTNSRSLEREAAAARSAEIARNLQAAAADVGRDYVLVSRSDSTLRGHFPAETDALMMASGLPVDGILLVPFFEEGGRYTIDDVHYVREGGWLIPAADTEYARDPVFGYTSSNLRQWVAERCGCSPDTVASISLADLRGGGPRRVEICLSELENAQPCIVNATCYRDLEVLVAALLASEAQGRRYLCRTAASFVRVRGGLDPAPLLTAADLGGRRGGLIIAGSYVRRTTEQIKAARALKGVEPVELDVPGLFTGSPSAVIDAARAAAAGAMAAGRDALVHTSRERVQASGGSALDTGRQVSQALVDLVAGLAIQPAWIVAKGGITSSDIATEALGIRRAWVRGQAIPGVPIWRTGPEARWPAMDYVVFPGNVGEPESLARMIQLLRGTR
ncbi:MAG: hypothetical protein GXX94_03695 [Chloroflexi bacterium]|nr:hypothetical protein [Chloroflexota bacterium]